MHIPQSLSKLIPNNKLIYSAAIRDAVITRIAVMILRDIQRKSIDAILEVILKAAVLLQELEEKNTGLEYFEILMRYIFSARPDFTKDDFYELVNKIETTYPEGSEKVMTLAQAFREEGWEEGRKEGQKEGRKEGREEGEAKALARTVIKFLVKRFDSVPEDLQQGIAKLDTPTLDVILDKILDFKNLDEVKKYIQ